MKIYKKDVVSAFDVDDTLVLWDFPEDAKQIVITCPLVGTVHRLSPHEPHIELLKKHKARGKLVVVWSQGGYEWAEAVIKALGLEKYVDLVLSKPSTYTDDLPVQAWMENRIYLKPDSKWGLEE